MAEQILLPSEIRTIKKDQFLIVRGAASCGLTARGRVMQSPLDQIITFQRPNKYHNIKLQHISGPLKGIFIHFTLALARKARIQNTCLCEAYSYPHNQGKGKCQTKN